MKYKKHVARSTRLVLFVCYDKKIVIFLYFIMYNSYVQLFRYIIKVIVVKSLFTSTLMYIHYFFNIDLN